MRINEKTVREKELSAGGHPGNTWSPAWDLASAHGDPNGHLGAPPSHCGCQNETEMLVFLP